MILKVLLLFVIIINGLFAVTFIRDLIKNKGMFMKEDGNPIVMAISSFIIFVLSTFGISDFAVSTVLYRKMKFVNDKKLPGTLNTQCVLPVAAMALIYISSIEVEITTLLVCIIAQVIGAYIGPRFVVKMNVTSIKKFISVGLIIAAVLILMGKFGVYPSGGEAVGLTGWKLVMLGVLSLLFGAFNNVGIGSYALTMATVYALGLNPAVAFPIMMGACTFSVPVGSMQFIKLDSYSRKITFFTSTFGVLGVIVAAYVVKSLNVGMLQWVVVIVLLYSAYNMISEIIKNRNMQNA
ncbi:sulfite exporter TauE/SafE family protein [Clostridium sp. UBA4395]|uniref:sulfite exporter TauE/SafE family protein n=1 Tax=Clostridium sp. UBA4395 TaxID=1946360 RepID=UPI0032174210